MSISSAAESAKLSIGGNVSEDTEEIEELEEAANELESMYEARSDDDQEDPDEDDLEQAEFRLIDAYDAVLSASSALEEAASDLYGLCEMVEKTFGKDELKEIQKAQLGIRRARYQARRDADTTK